MRLKIVGILVILLISMQIPLTFSAPKKEITIEITASLSGRVGRVGSDYTTVHDAETGNELAHNGTASVLDCGQQLQAGWFTVMRGFFRFDTTMLAREHEIVSAFLKIKGQDKKGSAEWKLRVLEWTDGDNGLSVADYSKIGTETFDGNLVGYTNFDIYNYNNIELTDYRIIKKGEWTYIAIRTDRDIDGMEPTGLELFQYWTTEISPPKLEITHFQQTKGGSPAPITQVPDHVLEIWKRIAHPVFNAFINLKITWEGVGAMFLVLGVGYCGVWLFRRLHKPKRRRFRIKRVDVF